MGCVKNVDSFFAHPFSCSNRSKYCVESGLLLFILWNDIIKVIDRKAVNKKNKGIITVN